MTGTTADIMAAYYSVHQEGVQQAVDLRLSRSERLSRDCQTLISKT